MRKPPCYEITQKKPIHTGVDVSKVVILNIQTLSYSGTTWLNLLLGSHSDTFAFGPPHRAWALREKKFEGACLIHGKNCDFWSRFGETWNEDDNFFLALAKASGKRVFLMDNASQDFINATMSHPDVQLLHGRYVRDGRAITASYARKMKAKGVSYISSIMPDGWFYPSFQGIPILETLRSQGHLVARYEDAVTDQAAFLKAAGDFIGINYTPDSYRFWEWDHHITSGNYGPMAMVKLHQGLATANFESADIYRGQLERLKQNPTEAFNDERWKSQLTREDLFWFDQLMGGKNELLGYERDTFSQEEIESFVVKGLSDSDFAAKIPEDLLKTLRLIADQKKKPVGIGAAVGIDAPLFNNTVSGGVAVRTEHVALERMPFAVSSRVQGSQGTEYQFEYDVRRLAALNPYKAVPSSMTSDEVAAMVNVNFFHAYGADTAQKTAAHVTVDPMWQYEDLLKTLKAVPNLRFATVKDALKHPPQGKEVVCVIRHDVDGDLVAARMEAEIEASLGISTSYYLLHTAPYYAISNGEVFLRNEASGKEYLYIQSRGHELALHTDGMTLYQFNNIDGAGAIVEELAWLRSIGCDIRGSTAHNSFSIYGCNNYSIFKNRPVTVDVPGNAKGVIHNGNWAPLQVLSEAELGLEYEANELFWQEKTPVLYGCLRTQNNWYIAQNLFGMLSPESVKKRALVFEKSGSQHDMIDAVLAVKGPAYVNLVVHPMHYGLRHTADEGPWLAAKPADEQRGNVRFWAGGGPDGAVVSSAITVVNEFGTPDRGLKSYETADFRIAVLGGDQIQTHTVSADSKYSQVAARLLRGPLAKPESTAASCAFGRMSIQPMRDALDKMSEIARPDVIVIALGGDCDDQRISLANELTGQGRVVICVLEGDVRHFDDSGKLSASLRPQLSSRLLDPSSKFQSYRGGARLCWHDTGIWSPQAHAIMGTMLADEIIKAFKVKASKSKTAHGDSPDESSPWTIPVLASADK